MLGCIVLYGYEMYGGGYTWSPRDNDVCRAHQDELRGWQNL